MDGLIEGQPHGMGSPQRAVPIDKLGDASDSARRLPRDPTPSSGEPAGGRTDSQQCRDAGTSPRRFRSSALPG